MQSSYFSIVVPVYNAEKYLSKCLDSILAQTFEDYEVILVNDGSTDGCLDICKAYQQKDTRIHRVDQSNQGLFMARRNGMKQTSGQYIVHIDADDSCVPMLLEEIKGRIEQWDADCVIYQYDVIDIQDQLLQTIPPVFPDNSFFDEKTKVALFEKLAESDCLNTVCVKCSHRDVAGVHEELGKFAGIIMGEDVIHTANIFRRARRVVYINQALYHYRCNPKSLSRNLRKKDIMDILTVKKYLHDTIVACGLKTVLPIFFRRYAHDLANYLMKMNLVCQRKRDYQELYCDVQSQIREYGMNPLENASIVSRFALILVHPALYFPGKLLAKLYNRMV